MSSTGRAIVLTLPPGLYELIQQSIRDEGLEPDRDTTQRWMIGALTFTCAACSAAGYQAICDALGKAAGAELPTTVIDFPPPTPGKH